MTTESLWISKTGLDAQQKQIAVIANNLANVSTIGFKRGRAVFNDLLYQTVRQPGANSSQNTELPSGFMLGTGVRTVATEKIYSQGSVIQTDNPFDVAISGKGFFEILLPDGSTAYTRDGAFQVNANGEVVTASGFLLQPAITVPASVDSMTIANDGTVTVLLTGSPTPTQIGTLQVTDFINPTGLQPIGNNLAKETAASGSPQSGTPGMSGLGTLIQGSLESSNVNVVEELVNMIEAQRAYEMNSKAIATTDQMLQYANNNL
ncbi:MAG: flagellar basal-body rod protein FlgG [Gammaproteobacteria bacterium]